MEANRRSGKDRRSNAEISARLDEIEKGYKARSDENRALIEKFAKWTAIILAVLAVVQLGLGILSVSLLVQNGDQQNVNAHQQDDIGATVASIQQQRAEAVWDACRSQNYRHDLTIDRLRALVKRIKDPAEKVRAQSNIASTVSLIDALAPPQNCRLLLADRFHLKGAPLARLASKLEAQLGPPRPPKMP